MADEKAIQSEWESFKTGTPLSQRALPDKEEQAAIAEMRAALAAELAPDEVQVNALCPGWVDTDMAREGLEDMARGLSISVEEARRQALGEVPLGRMSRPEDVAGMVAWLISPDARGVTGQGLDMNGGAFMI